MAPVRKVFLKFFERLFSIDMRSLAFVRIATAAILLIDLFNRSPYIVEFYTTEGFLYQQGFRLGDGLWTFHTLVDHPLWVGGTFLLHGIFALALMLGYKTSLATLGSFLFTVSLHYANPLVAQSGGQIIRFLLFFGLFLQWGRAYSIDAARKGFLKEEAYALSPWSAAALVTFGLMYIFSVLHKSGLPWIDGTATYEAVVGYGTSVGLLLAKFPPLSPVLTFGVLTLQKAAPFLLFSPIFTSVTRTVAVFLLLIMHLAFGWCLI